jgi:hypothetical protein
MALPVAQNALKLPRDASVMTHSVQAQFEPCGLRKARIVKGFIKLYYHLPWQALKLPALPSCKSVSPAAGHQHCIYPTKAVGITPQLAQQRQWQFYRMYSFN